MQSTSLPMNQDCFGFWTWATTRRLASQAIQGGDAVFGSEVV